MTLKDVQVGASGTFEQIVGESAGVYSFYPNPLAPPISYDPELVVILAEANRCLGELAGLARQLPNPHLLIQPFMKREAVLSSRIEGTEAEVEEVFAFEAGRQALLPGLVRSVDRQAVREVSSYVRAMEEGLRRLDSLPVSLRLIQEMHGTLLRGVRGRDRAPGDFRRVQNWIGPEGCRIDEARYVPPSIPRMKEALHAFETYLHESSPTVPPLVRLALIHYQFEAIHPFLDGNGRIGRLLVSLLLVHWNLLPLPLLYLSAYFERNRARYYELLLKVSEESAWNEWIGFFLRGVQEQSVAANTLTMRLQALQAEWREKVARPGSSALVPKLIDSLFEMPYTTIPQAAARLGVTYPTAHKHIESLVSQEILYEILESYPRVFVAREVIRLSSSTEG